MRYEDASGRMLYADASGEMRLASVAAYTHIQWTLLDALMPAEQGHVAYRTQLK